MRRANEAVQPRPTMEDFLPHIGKGKFFTKLDVKNAFHQVWFRILCWKKNGKKENEYEKKERKVMNEKKLVSTVNKLIELSSRIE